jgi:hypothetical protein
MRRPSNHEHAPPFVIDGISPIDLHGGVGFERCGMEVTSPTSPKDNGSLVEDVVDRVDGWAIDANDADSANAVSLETQEALFVTKYFQLR